MAQDLMGYQDALRGVVRHALTRAAGSGLPGAHHFYITFRSHAEGVDIGEDLLEAHPEHMTIVLEKQFWDLAVDDEAFEVTLKFNRIPKYLRIPFSAVSQFHDPAVGFILRFDAPEGEAATGDGVDDGEPSASGQVVSLDAFRKKPD